MAFNYSNPYASATAQTSISQPRSTFAATQAAGSQRYQVLFSGLPPDVSEQDVKDILYAPPLSLPASTTKVTCFYNADKLFLGIASISVGNEVDAERIRQEYSGQLIDNTYRLMVQHVLAPTSVLPSPSVAPIAQPSSIVPKRTKSAPPPTAPAKAPPKAAGREGKAPGLQLLARINKPKQADQLSLLARQKANLKTTGAGKDLLARLARSKPPANKPKSLPVKKTGGQVARAKAASNKTGGDGDVEMRGAGKKAARPKAKTQEELDAEMVAYERARRFGTTA